MKLVSAQVEKFRNIVDSDEFPVQPDVTCLVGKNESGKTAVLQALYRLNPVEPSDQFVALSHYPRRLFFRDRRDGVIDDMAAVTATFELESEDRKALDERFGPGTVSSSRVVARRFYDNQLFVDLADGEPDESNAVRYLIERASVGASTIPQIGGATTFETLREVLAALEATSAGDAETRNDLAAIRLGLTRMLGSETAYLADAVAGALVELLPVIYYFGEYNLLEGRVDLNRLLELPESELTGGERTAKALLSLVSSDNEALLNDEYEERKVELEAVSDQLTSQMAEYWQQSKELAVSIDVDRTSEELATGAVAVTHWLEVRVQDRRHGHTTNFNERSSGFRWFFSFLADFSRYEGAAERMIILLDEPGLELHVKAQRDLVRFIEDRLAPEHQVVYTTHSPFMIDPTRLDRVRVVEDGGADLGSKVTAEIWGCDPDTAFPIQAALAFELTANLFPDPYTLLVNRASDATYLQVVSDHLKAVGRVHLDDRWTMIPAGGLSRLGAVLALLGHQGSASVLVSDVAHAELLGRLAQRDGDARLVFAHQVTDTQEADVEDLFDPGDYVAIFNVAFREDGHPPLSAAELAPGGRIVERITAVRGEFDRGAPAEILFRHREQIVGALSEATLANFERLCGLINASAG